CSTRGLRSPAQAPRSTGCSTRVTASVTVGTGAFAIAGVYRVDWALVPAVAEGAGSGRSGLPRPSARATRKSPLDTVPGRLIGGAGLAMLLR
ncbi:hypothetical protein CEE97_11330, partial [Lactobacillus crispatus]